jgi:Uma2 family endonuclease
MRGKTGTEQAFFTDSSSKIGKMSESGFDSPFVHFSVSLAKLWEMEPKATATYSYDAYLALEAESEQKYEYHDGFIVAMAGGTPVHSQICGNVIRFLGNKLELAKKPCIVHTSDLKVHIESSRRTFYPDVSVVCGPPQYSERDPNALLNPILIVEVLSESTAAFDMGAKFSHYRKIPSLREYVLISQEAAVVDTYYRTENKLWEIRTMQGLTEPIQLKSIGCTIQMEEVYRLVSDLAEPESL